MTRKFIQNPDVAFRIIKGEAVLVFDNKLLTLNETGSKIWTFIENKADFEQIIQFLIEEYDVSNEDARKDADDFLSQLKEHNMIIEESL